MTRKKFKDPAWEEAKRVAAEGLTREAQYRPATMDVEVDGRKFRLTTASVMRAIGAESPELNKYRLPKK
jgi:hypothetical protein